MRGIVRKFVIALALIAVVGPPAFADRAQRRHPRAGTGHGQRYDRGRQYRAPRYERHYRPYRPYYRYQRPRHHFWSPRAMYNCRAWFRGYWAYDRYGEYWVPGHYGFVPCRY